MSSKIVFAGLIAVILFLGSSFFMKRNAVIPTVRAPANQAVVTTTVIPAPVSNPPKTDEEWKKVLTADQYNILREKGTEVPFSSPLDYEDRPGTYYTADCHQAVFRSEQKYDSGTGWPSFWAPINPDDVVLQKDNTLGVERTEVLSKCGGHLGHVFNDGPAPTGLRYCMNGEALIFVPDGPEKQQ